MPDYILIRDPQGAGWHKASESGLPDETTLQRLVQDNPDILPFDDLGEDTPPLLTIGRESVLRNGFVDVIGIDRTGLITIIECKLDRNPEVKRKVIGQILAYAAHLWGMTYEQFDADIVRPYFDSPNCRAKELRGVALDDAVERMLANQNPDEEWSKEQFRIQVTDNLAQGRFRLVIVVDKVNDELRRTVEYLNACTAPNFEMLCAELRYFATNTTELLIPALIGKPPVTRTTDVSRGQVWDEAHFFATLHERAGKEAVDAAKALLTWCQDNCDAVSWGHGNVDGSFSGVINRDGNRRAVPIAVYSFGRLEIGLSFLKRYPPFDQEALRRECVARLSQIGGLNIPSDAYDRRPTVDLSTLSETNRLKQFLGVMNWVVKALREGKAE